MVNLTGERFDTRNIWISCGAEHTRSADDCVERFTEWFPIFRFRGDVPQLGLGIEMVLDDIDAGSNVAYYTVLFSDVTDVLLDLFGRCKILTPRVLFLKLELVEIAVRI